LLSRTLNRHRRPGRALVVPVVALAALIAGGSSVRAAALHTAEVEVASGAVVVEQGGSAGGSLAFSAQGAISCTTGREDPPATITFDSAYALDAQGTISSSEPAVVAFRSDGVQKGGSSNCGVTWDGAPDPYVQAVRISADPATPVGDYVVDVDQEIENSPDTGSSGKLGGASTTIAVRVVPPTPAAPLEPAPVELPPAAQVVLGERRAPLRPDLGKTVLLEPVSGRVLVKSPGGRTIVLSELVEVPNGSSVDATRGVVRVTVESDTAGTLQNAQAWDGAFKVRQGGGAAPLTVFHLAGGLKASRAGRAVAAAAKRRRLWVNGKGSFSSRGRRASAIVRGTQWLVEEVAAGTRVRVRTGTVRVRDFALGRDFLVRAGGSYLARERRATARRAPAFTGRAR